MFNDAKVSHLARVRERRELTTQQLVAMRLVASDAIKANQKFGSRYENGPSEFVHSLFGMKPATTERWLTCYRICGAPATGRGTVAQGPDHERADPARRGAGWGQVGKSKRNYYQRVYGDTLANHFVVLRLVGEVVLERGPRTPLAVLLAASLLSTTRPRSAGTRDGEHDHLRSCVAADHIRPAVEPVQLRPEARARAR